MKTLRTIILCIILGIAVVGCGSQSQPTNQASSHSENATEKEKEKGAQMSTDQAGGSVATINTNHGSIRIQLFPKEAPKTVENFVKLSNDGFYDGVIFHRVIPSFMIQGGIRLGQAWAAQGINSRTSSILLSPLIPPDIWPWRMLAQIRMVASFSLQRYPHHT